MPDKPKVTNEKPLRIPLPYKDALKAFLETLPECRKAKKTTRSKPKSKNAER